MCITCPHHEEYHTGEWFNHIWFLHTLQEAGYPFKADELTLEEWQGLFQMKRALDAPLPKDG